MRTVRIHADDFGLCKARDRGILELARKGRISAASLVVNGPNAESAVAAARDAGLALGLHINLTEGIPLCDKVHAHVLCGGPYDDGSGEAHYALPPLAGAGPPRLCGKMGLRKLLARDPRVAEACAAEVHAQMDRFIEMVGDTPVHIDGHQHVHILPELVECVAVVAATAQVAHVRVPAAPPPHGEQRTAFLAQVARLAVLARPTFILHGLATSAVFIGLDEMGISLAGDRIEQVLRSTPLCASTAELMVHPGYPAHEWDIFNADAARSHELDVLGNGDIEDAIRRAHWSVLCTRSVHSTERAESSARSPGDAQHPSATCECGLDIRVREGWIRCRNAAEHRDGNSANVCADEERDASRAVASMPLHGKRILFLGRGTRATGNQTTAERLCAHFTALGATTVCVDTGALSHLDAKMLATSMRRMEDDNRPSLVVALHALHGGQLAQYATAPVVVILGGTDVNEPLPDTAAQCIVRSVLARAVAVVAFSPSMARAAKDLGARPETVRLIPQAAPCVEPLLPPPASAGCLQAHALLPSRAKCALLIASYRPVKEPMYLVSEWRQLHARMPDVWLVIVGAVLDHAVATAAAQSAAQDESGIRALAAVSPPVLRAFLRDAFCLVNTSRSEGQCGCILEAFVAGCPVVARACDGNAEIVRDGETGLLFASPADAVAAIERLACGDRLCSHVVEQARAYARSYHDSEQERGAYRALLTSVCASSGNAP